MNLHSNFSLIFKFAWKLLTEKSLWPNLFKVKYAKDQHLSLVNPLKGSWFWKMAMEAIPFVLSRSKWQVKEGNLSFWRDKWLETGPICNEIQIADFLTLKLKECMVENSWDLEFLVQLVGWEYSDKIFSHVGGMKDGSNILIWLGHVDGRFTTSNAWDLVRVIAPKRQWSEWIWHATLPKKFSVAMWKDFSQSLSVDHHIRPIGISMVSKCEYCEEGNFEDLNHVLYGGRIASKLWKICSNFLGIPCVENCSWGESMEVWFRRLMTCII